MQDKNEVEKPSPKFPNTKTVSIPDDLLPAWDAVKNKSKLMQAALKFAQSRPNPNDAVRELVELSKK